MRSALRRRRCAPGAPDAGPKRKNAHQTTEEADCRASGMTFKPPEYVVGPSRSHEKDRTFLKGPDSGMQALACIA